MNHIQLTIEELKAKRKQCDDLIIAEGFGQTTTQPPPPAASGAKKGKRGPYKKRADVAAEPTPVPRTAAAVSVADPVETFGGAMKRVINRLKKFTKDELAAGVQRDFPETLKLVASPEQSLTANLAYWSAKGQLEKSGIGQLASYRVVETEFFAE